MLKVEEIDVSYGSLKVLKNVSISVKNNETVGIFGPNGHGKTTLLKTISGLLKPLKGIIEFKDQVISGVPPEKIVNMGLIHVPQGSQLFLDMTVEENLLMGAYRSTAWSKRRENLKSVYQLFPSLKERRNKKSSTLSGGERQMTAIGRGLMSSAELLMLDELTMGLAPKLGWEIINKISEIKETGIAIILVEQNIAYAAELSERMYLLENGEIKLSGNKEEVLSNKYVQEAYLGIA